MNSFVNGSGYGAGSCALSVVAKSSIGSGSAGDVAGSAICGGFTTGCGNIGSGTLYDFGGGGANSGSGGVSSRSFTGNDSIFSIRASSSSSICFVVCSEESFGNLFDMGFHPFLSLARASSAAYGTTNVRTILRQLAADYRTVPAGRPGSSPSCHGVPTPPRQRSLPLQRRW